MPSVPGRSERDIVVDVTIKSDTRGAKAAAGALGDVDTSAGKAGGSLRGMATDAQALNAEIVKTTKHLRDLELEMVRSGDRTMRRRVAQERSWLREIESIQKKLTPDVGSGALPDLKLPTSAVSGFAGTPMIGPAVVSGLAATLVAAAPTLGAIVAGGIAGAVGTAGMAAGIYAASKDPKVQDATHRFGEFVSNELARAGGPFVKPTIAAIDELEHVIARLDLKDTLAPLAKTVTPIVDGLSEFAEHLAPGLNAAISRMDAFAHVAGEDLGILGGSLGHFLDEVTSSPGALAGLDTAFRLLAGGIAILGDVLEDLSHAYMEFLRVNADLLEAGSRTAEFFGNHTLAVSLHAMSSELDGIADRAEAAAAGWMKLANAPDINKTIMIQSNVAYGNTPWTDYRAGERRASGGPVMAGVPYTINERGYETVTFPAAGVVHPASLTPAGGGGATVVVDFRGAEDAFARWMRQFIRIEGGTGTNSVQVALGQSS